FAYSNVTSSPTRRSSDLSRRAGTRSRERRGAPVSEHGQRAARSLVWTGLESFGLSGLSFLSLVVLSRFLGADEFGAAAIALGVRSEEHTSELQSRENLVC